MIKTWTINNQMIKNQLMKQFHPNQILISRKELLTLPSRIVKSTNKFHSMNLKTKFPLGIIKTINHLLIQNPKNSKSQIKSKANFIKKKVKMNMIINLKMLNLCLQIRAQVSKNKQRSLIIIPINKVLLLKIKNKCKLIMIMKLYIIKTLKQNR